MSLRDIAENPLFLWGELYRALEKQAVQKDGTLAIQGEATIPSNVANYLLLASFNMRNVSWGQEPVTTVPVPGWKKSREQIFSEIEEESEKERKSFLENAPKDISEFLTYMRSEKARKKDKKTTKKDMRSFDAREARNFVLKALLLSKGRGHGPLSDFSRIQKLNHISIFLSAADSFGHSRKEIIPRIKEWAGVDDERANDLLDDAIDLFAPHLSPKLKRSQTKARE
ncbi:hypothetical protein [Acetobacter sicerae]|uniref:hypothetical protein n=1 Tax=Acetobacter sicerae TaxID=85325 RepID=UPI00156BB3F3|nr:hypothetical protein [Acetobacter sicerae]NHN92320.1 hypothetical protein [Acetobacter sicerae]